ncbi:hypothetical protein AB0D90_23460 [Streptomyces althioticus]|uniref:hypothetical protein n=1 Tax=Streptomyces althioticus TaxID=83380 RepID=UPI0033F780B3
MWNGGGLSKRETEAAIERAVRRANGEYVPPVGDDRAAGCCCCGIPTLVLFGLVVFYCFLPFVRRLFDVVWG